jgi:integrase
MTDDELYDYLEPRYYDVVLLMRERRTTLDSLITDLLLCSNNQNYLDAWRQFLKFLDPNREVTAESIEEYKEALLSGSLGRHYAPATVSLKVKAIKSLVRKAFAADPEISAAQAFSLEQALSSIECPSVPVSASRITTLNRNQIRNLLHECSDKKVLPLIKTILLNGCRLNEALQLTRAGLRASGEGLYVHRGIIAKGGREIHLRITEAILDEIREQNIYTGTKWFPWSRKAATIRIKRAIEKTLGVNASAHTLRHSFATLALEEGISLQEVSEWLNHASPKTTAQYYLHGMRSEAGNRFSRGLVE